MKNSLLVHFKLLGYFNLKRKEPVSAKDGVIIKLIGVHYSPQTCSSCYLFLSPVLQLHELNYLCKPVGKGWMPVTCFWGGPHCPVSRWRLWPCLWCHGKNSLLKILRGEHYKAASPLEGYPLNVCGLHIMTMLPAYPRVTALGSGGGADILVWKYLLCVKSASHLEQW